MHYLLMYDVVEGYAERRAPFRKDHLAHAKAAVARGDLVLGGALANPVDGTILLFKGDSPAARASMGALSPAGWWAYFSVVTASHGLLDALTDGGRGIALLAPFSAERFYFPWRPIHVSPIGLRFFSARGLDVALSELQWVWVPCALAVGVAWWWRSRR